MNASRILLVGTVAVASVAMIGCEASTPETPEQKEIVASEAQTALMRMYDRDPSLRTVVRNAYGYAIYPRVGKGGFIAGAAGGRGEVYEQGRLVGYTTLKQVTVGAQAGGQTYDELIVFKDEPTFRNFQQNRYSPSANASAVAVKAGAGAGAGFEAGTATFILPTSGAMVEAAIGGQQYTYTPIEGAQNTDDMRNTDNSGSTENQ
jgi:lipid-binding SYLF domain-containing protein